jgi:hypothetical protein
MKKITILCLLSACTTLGPMPGTTGISAVPVGRPGVEAQLGAVPAFYLSQSTRDDAKGAPITQLSALLDVDRYLLRGLVVGARVFGPSGDTMGEPYVGYRTRLGEQLSVAGGAYGTAKRSESRLASYHATRMGGEAAIDAKVWEPAAWFALHAQTAVSATRIFASGTYCVDEMGIGKDCNETDPSLNVMVNGAQTGIYPAATGTLALDFARSAERRLAGVRLALLGGVGSMPLIENGVKTGSGTYATIGLTLSVTLGLGDPDSVSLRE